MTKHTSYIHKYIVMRTNKYTYKNTDTSKKKNKERCNSLHLFICSKVPIEYHSPIVVRGK